MTTESTVPQASALSPVSPEDLVGRVQELQAQLDASGDSATREVAEELVSAVVQMYGAGLEKIFGALASHGEAGEEIAAGLAEDPDVASLMLIHDLHPVPLETRVTEALEKVRPYMESHGGNVELLSLEDGVARIRLQGSCSDCKASSATLELAIKQALEEAAPDLWGLEVEGINEDPATGMPLPMADPAAPTGFELPVVNIGPGPGDDLRMADGGQTAAPLRPPSWYDVKGVSSIGLAQLVATDVEGTGLVIANVDGTLLAYHNHCAACNGALDRGELADGALACPECGRSYFLPRAGRSLDGENLQLEPVPLLQEQGRIRVALAL
ncbi:MAG TPA: NifU family protein [Solirubrobacteraceae bacterium]|jgi:Fe-S cluster biogenesis protein NfuA/nitrite reductase/ring-hydroxylating ferredoxin subunit|nr:NifU family protein [Solirubrobacteraceae bacterium]